VLASRQCLGWATLERPGRRCWVKRVVEVGGGGEEKGLDGVGWNAQGHFKVSTHGSMARRAFDSAIVYGACVWRANHVVVVLHKMAG